MSTGVYFDCLTCYCYCYGYSYIYCCSYSNIWWWIKSYIRKGIIVKVSRSSCLHKKKKLKKK